MKVPTTFFTETGEKKTKIHMKMEKTLESQNNPKQGKTNKN